MPASSYPRLHVPQLVRRGDLQLQLVAPSPTAAASSQVKGGEHDVRGKGGGRRSVAVMAIPRMMMISGAAVAGRSSPSTATSPDVLAAALLILEAGLLVETLVGVAVRGGGSRPRRLTIGIVGRPLLLFGERPLHVDGDVLVDELLRPFRPQVRHVALPAEF